jgi:hypothetical protein
VVDIAKDAKAYVIAYIYRSRSGFKVLTTVARIDLTPVQAVQSSSAHPHLSLSVRDEHLLEASNVPQPSDRVKSHVRRGCRTTLKRAALDVPIRSNDRAVGPLQVVLTNLDSEVRQTDVEGVARCNRGRACV